MNRITYIDPVCGPWPQVTLLMPGCVDICVDRFHELLFPLEHQEERFFVAPTKRDFEALSRRGLPPTKDRCYCDKIHSVFALRGIPFCVLERVYDRLFKGEKEPREIAFFQLREFEKNGQDFRAYNVFCVAGKQLWQSNGDKRMLIEIVPLAGMEVWLKDVPRTRGEPPSAIDCEVFQNGQTLIETKRCPVELDKGFMQFERILYQAERELINGANIQKTSANAVAKLGLLALENLVAYAPIAGHLRWRFRPGQTVKSLIGDLDRERRQVFDGLVLFPGVQKDIEKLVLATANVVPLMSETFVRHKCRENHVVTEQSPGRKASLVPVRLKRNGSVSSPDTPGSQMKQTQYPEVRAFEKELTQQAEVFELQLPRLLRKHEGKFVAICKGRIVGIGKDKEKLRTRVRKQCRSKNTVLLLQKIEPPSIHSI